MKNWVISLVFKWVFIDGGKEIQKKNIMTKFLEKIYKQKEFKDNWPTVCNGVIELLNDAVDEAKTARMWTHG